MPRKTMGIQVKKGMYKDIESVIVVTDKLKATFLPSQGGKLTSLVSGRQAATILPSARKKNTASWAWTPLTQRRNAPHTTTCSPPSTHGPILTDR